MRRGKDFFCLLLFSINSFGQNVTSFAGSGLEGSVDGTSSIASFSYPKGIVLDVVGDLYIADEGNYKVRKMSASGAVNTYAGNGTLGGVDGINTVASFSNPTGVAIDSSGNVYVADVGNNKIRKISATGIVTTFAGSGVQGFADGTSDTASFYYPHSIAVDASGNIFVADTFNHRIRKITSAGIVTTFAGNGSAGDIDGLGTAASFRFPQGIAVDPSGIIYVADTYNHKIRKISPLGVVTTLAGSGSNGAGNGIGTVASFSYPEGVAIDSNGNVYVTDTNNHKIRKISPTEVVTTFAGNGLIGSTDGNGINASFYFPSGITVDSIGNVYVGDNGNHKIRKITLNDLTVDDLTTKKSKLIYPNPVQNMLHINSEIETSKIDIYSNDGRLVKTTSLNKHIDVSNLAKGYYVVVITDEVSKIYIEKLIKE
jgi:sugar lactone lactonase YvrE